MFNHLAERFDSIFRNLRGLGKITDSNIQQTSREIRRILMEADVNFEVSKSFVSRVKDRAEGTKVLKSVKPGEQFIKIIHDELVLLLGKDAKPVEFGSKKPAVILMAGLQGAGKTTTCGKLANLLIHDNKSVMMVAADVYRPAAIDQLVQIGKSCNVSVFEQGAGDPVAICQNALEEARASNIDVVILDTAGRLHVDGEMMAEVQEIYEAVSPNEVFFVADGMTGQDAVNSAKAFSLALPLTGTILTKLDGDARGGAAVSITAVTKVPIRFIGVSEKIDGLEPFEPKRIVNRILGLGDVVTFVEKAQRLVDEEKAVALEKKLKKATFDLDDFKDQLIQLKQMGSLNQIMGMMPGINNKMLKGINLDDRHLVWTEAIISSMTLPERKDPTLINGSRRARIAKGSGRPVQEVNQLLRQFAQMKKMMKKMGKMKPSENLMNQMMGLN